MPMYMQQLLCLVTADFNPDLASGRLQPDRDALDRAFARAGFVHFASIAVLPGLPDAAPALMLELAIDEDVAPLDAVSRLVEVATQPLWALYGTDSAITAPTQRRRALEERLLPLVDTARAAGGFVGMRDRTAAQVHAESRWFFAARKMLARLRDEADAAGRAPVASEFVQRLMAGLDGDYGRAAMHTPPPRSFWRRPRPALLQLAGVLVWLVLPVPLLATLVAVVGWLVEFTMQRLLGEAGMLVTGSIASAALLVLGMAVLGLFRTGALAASVLAVGASLVGMVLFFAVIVAGHLRIGPAATGLWTHPLAIVSGVVVVALLLLLWWSMLTQRQVRVSRWAGRGAALAGATLGAYLFGSACHASVSLQADPPWRLLAYAIPWLLSLFLVWRSSSARWYFALALPLLIAMLLAGACVFTRWPGSDENLWTGVEALRHVAVGALALVDMAVLLGIAASAATLLLLRAPRWPLGAPLGAALLALVAVHLGIVAALQGLMSDLFPQTGSWTVIVDPRTYGWITAAVLVMGVLLLAMLAAVNAALPVIQRRIDKLDRPDPKAPFVPHLLHSSIVDNEAALFNRPSHMISLTDVRGGFWWSLNALMLWMWLHVIGEVGSLLFTRGWLGSAWGLKFAHWHLVQGGRRLLFVSNYDGDFGGYLDEFIRGASQGVNLVWRWTQLHPRPALGGQPGVKIARTYPKTQRFAFGGCHYEQAFKAYARASMVPHLYLYQAYALSNQDIERSTRLREALAGERTPQKDELVLRILQS